MNTRQQGFTIYELMYTLAIIAIVSAIAIPAYNGYIREAQLGTAMANARSVRLFLEEYFLENSTYVVDGDSSYDEVELETNFGWRPDGDRDAFTYTVTAEANSWDIVVTHRDGAWIRCENRMATCCDSDTAGASAVSCGGS
jgi:prepilin-type N-terminal cleavage/methylation domain-containing protein